MSVISILPAYPQHHVAAATNNFLNFQARLQTAAGAIVPDGYYNVEFKLYQTLTSSGSSQGSCTGDANCLWTETYYDTNGVTAGNDFRVRVQNGYLTVNLGSRTAFPTTINWDQQLWITMNIGGSTQTATPTYDGEMTPRLQLTAVPYAFKAGQLAQFNSGTGFTSTLSLTNPTGGNQTFVVPDIAAAGTYTLLTTTTANASYIQNTSSPQTANFNVTGNGTIGGNLTVNGNASLIKPTSNSLTAFQIQPAASTTPVFNADTTNSRVGIGTAAPGYTLDVAGNINTSTGFLVGGTAGATTTCSASQFLKQAVTVGGITTSGTCTAAVTGTSFTTVPTANGGSVSGNTLTLFGADATFAGLVTTSNQIFAGNKTFNGDVNVASTGNLTTSGSTTTIGAANSNGVTSVNDRLSLVGSTGTFTSGSRLQLAGNFSSSAITSQYGLQNAISFTPNGGSLNNVFGMTSFPTVAGSNYNIGQLSAINTGVATASGYTGQVASGYALDITAPTIAGTQLIPDYRGIHISGVTANGGNTSGTIDNYQFRANSNTTAAGTGGTLNNYGIYVGLGSGATSGTTNYGLSIVGAGGAGAANWAIYDTSSANNFLQGNTQIGGSAGANTYKLLVSGTANVTGGYSANGTAGVTTTCTGGQFLQNATTVGGITTGGTCAAAAASGVTTIGGIDTQAKSNDGAVISGSNLYLQTADAGKPGLVSTGTQTFAGDKTFSGNIIGNGNANLIKPTTNSTTAFQIQPAASTTPVFNVDTTNSRVGIGTATPGYALDVVGTINAGTQYLVGGTTSLTGTALTFAAASAATIQSASSQALNLTGNAASSYTTTAGALTLNGFAGVSLQTNGSNGLVLTSSSLSAASANVSLNVTAGANVTNIGTGSTTGQVSIGGGSNTISLGSNTTLTGSKTLTVGGVTTLNDRLILGALTTTSNYRAQISGALTLSAANTSTSQYGIQNNISFDPTLATNTNNLYGIANNPSLSASAQNLTKLVGINTSVDVTGGAGNYTGTLAAAYGLEITAPSITGTTVADYRGATISGVSTNGGNTTGLIENTQLRVAGNSAAAGVGGSLINYGIYTTVGTGGTTGTTNYGLYLTGNGGASSTDFAIYDTSNDANYLKGNLMLGGGTASYSNPSLYALQVAGDVNLTTGSVFRVNGTAGVTTTCTGGQFLQNATTVGGITTGGTCAAVSAGGVTTVGTIDFVTKSNDGVVISGTNIYMQTADASKPGLVSTGTQTFAGAKTFTGNVDFNTTTAASLTLGSGGNTTAITATGVTLSGTSRRATAIRLTAEYAGAVLDAGTFSANLGTMTSGIDLTNRMNYYKWTTTDPANQSYDVDVQVPIPNNFSAWDTSPVSISSYTSNTTNGTITVEARDTGGTVETGCNFTSVTPGSTGTWATSTSCALAGTYTAGGYMTLRIRLQSPTSGDVRVGNIVLNYKASY